MNDERITRLRKAIEHGMGINFQYEEAVALLDEIEALRKVSMLAKDYLASALLLDIANAEYQDNTTFEMANEVSKASERKQAPEDALRAKLCELYPDLKPSGLCSEHRSDGPLECPQCFPNYRAICGEHASVNAVLRAENERLKTCLEEIRNECSYYADGAPDASPRDHFANVLLGIIEHDANQKSR